MTDHNIAPRPRRQWSQITDVPPPDEDSSPVEALRHTLAHYASEPDDRFALIATTNVYADGQRTGLTYGDLRALLEITSGNFTAEC